MLFVHCVVSKEPRVGIDFFPLLIDYEERMSSIGRIPGGYNRSEGKASEKAILVSRLIDRPIRPLFAEGFRNEVQVVNTVMSCDPDASSEMTALFGSSLALCVSNIPFNGPVAGVVVAKVDDEYVINPSVEQAERAVLSLTPLRQSICASKELPNIFKKPGNRY